MNEHELREARSAYGDALAICRICAAKDGAAFKAMVGSYDNDDIETFLEDIVNLISALAHVSVTLAGVIADIDNSNTDAVFQDLLGAWRAVDE